MKKKSKKELLEFGRYFRDQLGNNLSIDVEVMEQEMALLFSNELYVKIDFLYGLWCRKGMEGVELKCLDVENINMGHLLEYMDFTNSSIKLKKVFLKECHTPVKRLEETGEIAHKYGDLQYPCLVYRYPVYKAIGMNIYVRSVPVTDYMLVHLRMTETELYASVSEEEKRVVTKKNIEWCKNNQYFDLFDFIQTMNKVAVY